METKRIETRLVRCKPTSPGRRHVVKLEVKGLHKGDPYWPLVEPLKSSGGRNNAGRISVRYRGGGHKRLYRIIDFKRDKHDIPGKVERFEYDPNRNAHIALILYPDGERRYIIAPKGLEIGQEVIASEKEVPIRVGNATRLRHIPVGTLLHNVELRPGKGGQLARAAGTSVQLLGKEGDYAIVRLKSGEMRKIHLDCKATIGEVGNEQFNLIKLGKAGASRWRGRRPHVRGVAMNPVDHPHGGGEGRNKGYKAPVSPWGWHTKGKKTRHNKRTDKWIIKRRK